MKESRRGRGGAGRARKPYHHGDLRRALLAAAFELAGREGPAAVSLREVARRAGVSSAAPYHHFADRGALLAALAEEGYARLLAVLEAARAKARRRKPAAQIEALGEAYFRFAGERPTDYAIMFLPELADPAQYPGPHRDGQRCLALIVAVLREADPRRSDAEALETAILLWSAVHGFAVLWNGAAFRHHPRFRTLAALPAGVARRLARLAESG
jgi:AcrR family transcriptional regulator